MNVSVFWSSDIEAVGVVVWPLYSHEMVAAGRACDVSHWTRTLSPVATVRGLLRAGGDGVTVVMQIKHL